MAFCVQARRGESWPDESDSGTFRNSRCPGAFEQLSTLARLQVPLGRRSSLGGAAEPPGSRSKTRVWESQARGRLSTGPPTLTSGPPLDQVQARDPRRAAHSLPPFFPSPSRYSAPPRLFTLPLSLTHHLVYSHPCTPPSPRRAPKSPGWAHLSDPNISAIRSARRRLAPGSLPPVIVLLDHTVRAPYGALAPVVK